MCGAPQAPEMSGRSVDGACARSTADRRAGRGAPGWLRRAALVAGSLVVLPCLIEAVFRLFPADPPVTFFVASGEPGVLETNPRFAWRFMPPALAREPCPLRLATRKPAGTLRVFVLGSSAAMGYPDPAYSVGRFLEAQLQAANPGARVEVVNAAMTAVDSHVVRVIADECARLQPDWFVVYCGNNEVVGPFGPGTVFRPLERLPVHARLRVLLSGTRVVQLLQRLRGPVDAGPSPGWGGMGMFLEHRIADGDSRLRDTRALYRRNIAAVCDAAARAGARVALCTVPVNLTDGPPFASAMPPGLSASAREALSNDLAAARTALGEGRPAEAARRLGAALPAADGHADLHFLLGTCAAAEGRPVDARAEWQRAADLDTLRFRADGAINGALRELAVERGGADVVLVDADAALSAGGSGAFHDHVHLSASGTHRMAAMIARAITGRDAPLDYAACAGRLLIGPAEEVRVAEMVAALLQRPPFTAWPDHAARMRSVEASLAALRAAVTPAAVAEWDRRYREALAARPDDDGLWECRAEFLAQHGTAEDEAAARGRVVELRPGDRFARRKLALALHRAGRADEALAALRAAARELFALPNEHKAMGDLFVATGHAGEAEACYRRALALDPRHPDAMANLGALRMRAGPQGEAEAERLFRRSLERSDDPAVRANLGLLLMKRGDYADAAAQLQRALAHRPYDATLHHNHGIALKMLGRDAEAAAEWEAALRLNPGHEKARRSLEQVRAAAGAGATPSAPR